ncbi:MAG: ATP-binding cassette domain-containing protein [Bacteroidota bacterium]|nr:ATP-binding cassette domain-containing protein [Bacteroidota bacterium]
MDIFVAKEVTKRYAAQTALSKVSINVPENSIYGLLGPNGAGKTTLLRIINQIIAPDEGTLFIHGEKLQPKHTAMIGYLPEERGLYKKMAVGEQALYLAQLKGVPRQIATKRLRTLFEKFEIQNWWTKNVEELSKGMQQKVQFIITIIHEPKLLIFDEPFSGFDPINATLLKDEILELREKGATIIFSTHNMASVEELCDDIALINKSKKILEGKVTDIKHTYRSNSYQLNYSGYPGDIVSLLPDNFTVLEQSSVDHLQTAKIQLPVGEKSNTLLQLVLPHVEVHSFNELLPSMNDIFIEKVKENRETVTANPS